MVCSSCGKDKILVYTGLVPGNLCKECYDKYMNTEAMGKARESEVSVYSVVESLGMTKEFTEELLNIHKRYLLNPVPKMFCTVDRRRNIQCVFNMRYRGKDSTIILTFDRDSNGVFIKETIAYPRADGMSMKVKKIYSGGKVVDGGLVRSNYKADRNNLLKVNEAKRNIMVTTYDGSQYIIKANDGAFIKGWESCGMGNYKQFRVYGRLDRFRVRNIVDSRWMKCRFRSLDELVDYLDATCGTSELRRDALMYKNGNSKYYLNVTYCGNSDIWSGKANGIVSARYVEDKNI